MKIASMHFLLLVGSNKAKIESYPLGGDGRGQRKVFLWPWSLSRKTASDCKKHGFMN